MAGAIRKASHDGLFWGTQGTRCICDNRCDLYHMTEGHIWGLREQVGV
jgi:hypothetical protein